MHGIISYICRLHGCKMKSHDRGCGSVTAGAVLYTSLESRYIHSEVSHGLETWSITVVKVEARTLARNSVVHRFTTQAFWPVLGIYEDTFLKPTREAFRHQAQRCANGLHRGIRGDMWGERWELVATILWSIHRDYINDQSGMRHAWLRIALLSMDANF